MHGSLVISPKVENIFKLDPIVKTDVPKHAKIK